METTSSSDKSHRSLAIVFVLGAPGAGKGTLSTHLAHTHNLAHYSVGDCLRVWMRENRSTPLAAEIQDKLENQGFLSAEALNPFLCQAILETAGRPEPEASGIILDGFPRCVEQLEAFGEWPFQDKKPLALDRAGEGPPVLQPDIVLSFHVTKDNAKARYLSRARDANDSEDKFERRFAEYERETVPVENIYRQRGILMQIDANGTKEENIQVLSNTLNESEIWRQIMVNKRTGALFLV
ncbi:adenylate kinase 1 ATP binding protein [Paramyrothecium foliicola]|nr:adenylate kinase 1 ATP binding protein [Paramyrothecium foliicola]